jgi:hypothetical protein
MATSLTIDRTTMRQLVAAMAFIMVIASLPAVGVIVAPDGSGPCISMDICHPLQSLDRAPGVVPIARPAQPNISANICSHEALVRFVPTAKTRFAEAPDPPPPKLFS